MPAFLNLSAYKFAPLSGLPELRARLLRVANDGALKGTVLLSSEGINLFVAGTRESLATFLAEVRAIAGLEDLAAKESESTDQPFGRMRVKIKKEIISFGVEGIDPARRPAPRLSPATLKQWLDEGRPVTLLDTRNDYEVNQGTFRGAVRAGIARFRDFPAAVRRLPPELKHQPVVTFCTGGIRCEKAAPFMQGEGFQQVFQLDGGILKYFEHCGGAHYEGECFVFDERVGVDASLQETGARLCEKCQRPVSGAGPSCETCTVSGDEPPASGAG